MPSYCIALLCISILIESLLSGGWNRWYFLSGIPLVSKKIAFSNSSRTFSKITEFIENLENSTSISGFKGKKSDESTFFFRRKWIQAFFIRKSSVNVMRGNIKIDVENRVVTVKGLLNYSNIFIIVYFLFIFSDFFSSPNDIVSALPVVLVLVLIIGISYLFEKKSIKK